MLNSKIKIFFNKSKPVLRVFAVISVTAWLVSVSGVIHDSPAYPATYIFTGLSALFFLNRLKDKTVKFSTFENIILNLAAAVLAFAIILATYNPIVIYNINPGIVLLYSFFAFIMFRAIIFGVSDYVENNNVNIRHRTQGGKIFRFTFICVCIVDFILLWGAYYPGIVSPDSLSQIRQGLEGWYSNHHPVYHTFIIQFFVGLGLSLFNNINKAVMLYIVVQVLFVAAVFSYTVMTVYQLGSPKAVVASVFAWYVFHPANIAYGITIWKDVIFSCVCLLFITAFYRSIKKTGNKPVIDNIIMLISAVGMCIFRSNGMLACAVAVVFFALFLGGNNKKMAVSLASALVLGVILKGPVLNSLEIPPPDTIESLSIPAQQIARVVADGGRLTPEQYELLNKIIDVEKIPEEYLNDISDPIKDLVRAKGNQQYLRDNKIEYLKLWIQLGLEYTGTYIKAWVDQTVGFWNGGYDYWIYYPGVIGNRIGIEHKVNSRFVYNRWLGYYDLFTDLNTVPVLNVVVSIGLMTWIMFIIFAVFFAKNMWEEAFITIPALAVVLTLLIATPVFCEFRYAYSSFTSVPLMIAVCMTAKKKNNF